MLTDEELDRLADRIILKMTPAKPPQDSAYHNTKLLLSNYHMLKAHVNVVADQLNSTKHTFWGHEHLNLNSLMQNKAKTVKLMTHVDDSLEWYRKLCREECSRGYQLLYQKYLADSKRTDEQIAYDYGVSRQAINNQVKTALNELSVILYGVDAIEKKLK